MVDHTGVSASDFAAASWLYDAIFAALGGKLLATIPLEYADSVSVTGYGRDRAVLWLNAGPAQTPPVHVVLSANRRAEDDAFYAAGPASALSCR